MPSELETRVDQVVSLLLAGVLVVSFYGRAGASACADTRLGKIEPTADGLRVDESAAPALRPGDFLTQLNSHRLQTCADLAEALSEARRNDLATLIVVRRDGATEVVLLSAPAAAAAVAAPAPVVPAMPGPAAVAVLTSIPTVVLVAPAAKVARVEPTAIPPSPVPTPPPARLTRADADSVREFLAKLMAFGNDVQAHQPLPKAQPWAQRVDRLRQDYTSEQARGVAMGVVEPVLGYYETIAQILLYKEDATRERRETRAKADIVLEYHTSSPVGAWLQRYPFLGASVIQEAEAFHFLTEGESNGQWLPDRAIALLVEHGLSEGAVLSAKLAAGTAG